MQIVELDGTRLAAVWACLPARSEDNLARCAEIYGDAKKAAGIVKATGIERRRVADAGVSSLDLCVAAASRLMSETGVRPGEIGAVIDVTFTPERAMPCNACQAQSRLGLPSDVAAFDVNLACSGWAYGLCVASTFAKATGKSVLLLDGDTQTPYMDAADKATVPVMADAGTAALVEPSAAPASAAPWRFSFLTDGAKGDALTLPFGGKIAMDGFGIFKFVTTDVFRFLREFMSATGAAAESIDAFVPHQANVYMVRQLAKPLGFPPEKVWISGDVFGNSSSATVPVTIAWRGGRGDNATRGDRRLFVSGFGGGLSASAALITLPSDCSLGLFDYGA